MAISVFDIYKVGVGPSSSHTFGPMVAAERFLKELEAENLFEKTAKAQIELYASMALTGKGHFTDLASMLGLEGNAPATLDSAKIPAKQARIEAEKTLNLGGKKMVPFDPAQDIKWYGDKSFPTHPNGIAFVGLGQDGKELKRALYFSIGGGFVICENQSLNPKEAVGDKETVPLHDRGDARRVLQEEGKQVDRADRIPERAHMAHRARDQGGTARDRGGDGEIRRDRARRRRRDPGPRAQAAREGDLGQGASGAVGRPALRAAGPRQRLRARRDGGECDARPGSHRPDHGCVGHRACGLQAYKKFGEDVTDDKICDFLLASGGCAIPVKINASFSGAEVGCQGEVGSASLMAATGLCQVLGGTVDQVLNAGAMALEHNLGLTCDPVAGLVQVPCIKRNALAANKAVNAVRLTMLRGEEPARPTFDQVVEVLYLTGKDMSDKYKETSQGGLAVVWVDC